MKIKTYQDGGGLIYTPFIPGQTGVNNSSSKSKAEDSEDAKLDPLDKEILNLIKDHLLPNETASIYQKLIQFQKASQHLSNMPGLGGTNAYRSAMPSMLKIMSLANQGKYNVERDKELEYVRLWWNGKNDGWKCW